MKKFSILSLCMLALSCEEIINEPNITRDSISLLAPTENVALKPNTAIAFHWESMTGATDYLLQVAEPDFNNASQILQDTLVQRTDFSIDSLTVGSYQWRVKALNSVFETSYTSHSFVVEKKP